MLLCGSGQDEAEGDDMEFVILAASRPTQISRSLAGNTVVLFQGALTSGRFDFVGGLIPHCWPRRLDIGISPHASRDQRSLAADLFGLASGIGFSACCQGGAPQMPVRTAVTLHRLVSSWSCSVVHFPYEWLSVAWWCPCKMT